MTTGGLGGDEIQEESSWRYPLAFFLATLVLCAVFLYYYVGPSIDELGGNEPSPAVSDERVTLTVADLSISVPANYTVYPRDRREGQRREIYLYALWSTFSGYTAARRDDFMDDSPRSRRVDIILAERTSTFGEAERIEKLFLPKTKDRPGELTASQLVRYEFHERPSDVPTNGYAENELYIGRSDDGDAIAIFCVRDQAAVSSPSCWREFEITDRVSVTYKFKKPYLPEWRAIDRQVVGFIDSMKR